MAFAEALHSFRLEPARGFRGGSFAPSDVRVGELRTVLVRFAWLRYAIALSVFMTLGRRRSCLWRRL